MKRIIAGATFYREVMKVLQSGCPGTETVWISDGWSTRCGRREHRPTRSKSSCGNVSEKNSFLEEVLTGGNTTADQ
jgi:hypothetical protein